MSNRKISKCPICDVDPGRPHQGVCNVERCSVCGGQHISCGCEGHDRDFSRWTGVWPGKAEAEYLGISMNDLYGDEDLRRALFVKPESRDEGSSVELYKELDPSWHDRKGLFVVYGIKKIFFDGKCDYYDSELKMVKADNKEDALSQVVTGDKEDYCSIEAWRVE